MKKKNLKKVRLNKIKVARLDTTEKMKIKGGTGTMPSDVLCDINWTSIISGDCTQKLIE